MPCDPEAARSNARQDWGSLSLSFGPWCLHLPRILRKALRLPLALLHPGAKSATGQGRGFAKHCTAGAHSLRHLLTRLLTPENLLEQTTEPPQLQHEPVPLRVPSTLAWDLAHSTSPAPHTFSAHSRPQGPAAPPGTPSCWAVNLSAVLGSAYSPTVSAGLGWGALCLQTAAPGWRAAWGPLRAHPQHAAAHWAQRGPHSTAIEHGPSGPQRRRDVGTLRQATAYGRRKAICPSASIHQRRAPLHVPPNGEPLDKAAGAAARRCSPVSSLLQVIPSIKPKTDALLSLPCYALYTGLDVQCPQKACVLKAWFPE